MIKKLSLTLLIAIAVIGLSVSILIYTSNFIAPLIKQNIVIDALPKSGSTYLRALLSGGLGYKNVSIVPDLMNISLVDPYYSMTQFFSQLHMLGTQHLRAPIDLSAKGKHLGPPIMDMEQLKQYTDRKVVHIRDPRSALLSFVHFINKYKEESHVYPPRPPVYYELSLHEQIDWAIDNLFPRLVNWIQMWLDYKDMEDSKIFGFKILITTYDELVADQEALCKKIIAFYGIPPEKFVYTHLAKDSDVNFRKGDPNEWRQVFTEQQKQKISDMVPESLLQRFNWEK